MKYSEFKKKLEVIDGLVVSDFDAYIRVTFIKEEFGEKFTIAEIYERQEGLCEVNLSELSEIYDVGDRKKIIQSVVEYANTKLENRRDKYCWKLKGIWLGDVDYGYLSKNSHTGGLTIGYKDYVTKFTESEFKAFAEKYGFVSEAFEKEPIQ